MTEKEKKERGEISRREFLKDAGLVVGGAAIGSTVLLAACAGEETTETVTATQTTTQTVTTTETVEVPMTLPASEKYLVVDAEMCCSCLTCMISCSLAHEGKPSLSLSRIQVTRDPLVPFPEDVVQQQCRQCVNPLCVQACPTGACHVDTANGNIRVIDESLCIGCKQCIEACPFIPHRTIWNPEKNVAMKCDLCTDTPYWDGDEPACVANCPMEAIAVTTDIPTQLGDEGYKVDLKPEGWLG